jgi:hypothetical protein
MTMKIPATTGNNHSQRAARLRVCREIERATPMLEYWIAATGPFRPRHIKMSGSSASSHSHSGCRK